MTELAFAIARTIVRLGEAVPDIPIASAVDFILPRLNIHHLASLVAGRHLGVKSVRSLTLVALGGRWGPRLR